MTRRSLTVLGCLAALGAPAPAGAVVGGEPIDQSSVPTFAHYGCGGTLVAPDRVVTALHCIAQLPYSSIESITVGGVPNRVANISMHPTWRKRNATNWVNDIAIMQLATPVTDIAPATLGDASDHVGELGIIVGNGRSRAPGSGGGEGFGSGLHAADLKIMSDAGCRTAFGKAKGNSGETFIASGSFCAIDADGKAPLKSGCNGDSGGPLYVGPASSPTLLGVVSYGGRRCGADHLPSVFADVGEFRAFITDPHPVWAPRSTSPAEISGTRRPGGTLRCSVADVPAGARAEFTWKRFGRGASGEVVGRRARVKVSRRDGGARYGCFAVVSNAGGFLMVPEGPRTLAKIGR